MNIYFRSTSFFISAMDRKCECEKEIELVEKTTKLMCEELDLQVDAGCEDEYEYYNQVSFDSFLNSRQEIKELFKTIKKMLK